MEFKSTFQVHTNSIKYTLKGSDYWEAVSGSPEGLRIYVIF